MVVCSIVKPLACSVQLISMYERLFFLWFSEIEIFIIFTYYSYCLMFYLLEIVDVLGNF
jgi:hypothetical protein